MNDRSNDPSHHERTLLPHLAPVDTRDKHLLQLDRQGLECEKTSKQRKEGRKEMFYFMYLRLYGVVYLVNDHINNEREYLLLFAIGGRGQTIYMPISTEGGQKAHPPQTDSPV